MIFFLFALIIFTAACSSQKHMRGPSSVCLSEKDCSRVQVKKANFVLLFRNEHGTEIWKDKKSGLVWSDRLPKALTQVKALESCKNLKIGNKSWVLPTLDEYREAQHDGLELVSQNSNGEIYWSSSVRYFDISGAEWGGCYEPTGITTRFSYCPKERSLIVRCVSR